MVVTLSIMTREVLVLREPEIRALLDTASCLEAVENAFSDYARGRAELPAVINLDIPESRGEVHVKAGHLHGKAQYAVKIASGFADNAARGLPSSDGMVLMFDAGSGAPAALLLDNGFITDRRTGAAGAVAARHLARRDAAVAAVIGCGIQARQQIEALWLVRRLREVRIYGRRPEMARACADDLASADGRPDGCRFFPCASIREAVSGADIVVTVTASRQPLLQADWIAPGCHITAVGSDGPDKRELDSALLRRADLLVADSLDQCLRLGEIHHAVSDGTIDSAAVGAELGEITAGLKPGREDDRQITVCDLTGVGVQDVAAANLVLERARADGIGEHLVL